MVNANISNVGNLSGGNQFAMTRGGSRIFGKGVHIYIKVWGFVLLILSLFFKKKISHENEIVWSHWDQTISFSSNI